MEDYEAAYLERVRDVEALHKAGRRTAAMHFGGVAIECLLKYMIFASLAKDATWEWKTDTNDPGHTISNPGHNYEAALKCYNRLRDHVQKSPHVKKWLYEVENPDGPFIDARYLGNSPDDEKYKHWMEAYRGLKGWLQKQLTQL
ncbi:MAG: hypothetical protein NVSMB38_19420 [Ktedonobacteraceae bacterium]